MALAHSLTRISTLIMFITYQFQRSLPPKIYPCILKTNGESHRYSFPSLNPSKQKQKRKFK